MRVVALHGLPTSPRLWERLQLPPAWTLEAPPVPGLGDDGTPKEWSLHWAAERLRQAVQGADLLVGHDLGGALVAMLAAPGQSVVLSGTALGQYWTAIRATALPRVADFFYFKHAGRRFLSQGCLPEHAPSLLEAFGDHGPDWADRMRRVARGMRPPLGLAMRLRACGVRLAWGRQDPWYPPWIARTIERTTGGRLHWLEAGHFAPWEDPRGFVRVLTGEAFVGKAG
jgi:pimeloyl-ACP methyl ester carboxylesterase